MNNVNKRVNLELDELDLKLAKELELDARQSIRVLAKKLAISHATVKKRLQRLMDEGFLAIITLPSSLSMGLQAAISIGLNVSPGKVDEVAYRLKYYKCAQIITITNGRYDILMTVVLRDHREVARFFDEELSHIPYLVNAEEIPYSDRIKMSWKYLNADTNRYKEPVHRDLDELDLRMIKELELCPRESVINLGRKLGVNRWLAGKRLQALLDDRVIRVVSVVEPSLFGFSVGVTIFVRVQPGKVGTVVDSLVAERRIPIIFKGTGRFELLLNAYFRDLEEMSDFLRNQLDNYPGVLSHETLIQIKFVKRSFSVLTLGEHSG